MELRDVLKRMRGELGINQAELANALHVSFATVNRWETGKTCPNRSILAAITEYAHSHGVSESCAVQLREAIASVKRSKIAASGEGRRHDDAAQSHGEASFLHQPDAAGQKAAEAIMERLFSIDYETITTIDAETGEATPFLGSHIRDVMTEQKTAGNHVAGVEAYLRKYCADEDVARVIEETGLPYMKAQLETKAYYHVTYSLRQNGRTVYKRALYTYLDSRRGTILCAMQDLTDLHALENAKRNQLAEAFQALQEQGGMDVARYDIKTHRFYSNSAMASAVGFGSVIENVPDTFIEQGLIAPAFAEKYREFFDKMRQGKPGVITVPCKVADGSYHWLRVDAQLLYDKDRRPYQALMSFKDVDEEREHAAVYRKWRQSLEQKKPESYTLFRSNLSKGTTFDKSEGTLLRPELLTFLPESFNGRTLNYAGRFVHMDDFDAYTALLNADNLLASYYRGTRKAEMCYRERMTEGVYRWLRVTAEMAQYPDTDDIELFLLYEPCDAPKENKRPAPQKERTVFDDSGVIVATCEWPGCRFLYDREMGSRMQGVYDQRPIWEIFMADRVADTQDVKALKHLVYELAESPERKNGAMDLLLKTASGARHWFTVNVFKRVDGTNNSRMLVLTFLDVNDDVLTNKQLRFRAEHDSLTGLYNRAAFLHLVTETVRDKPADTFVLLCSDINDFRFFNDRYGRAEGDRLLQFGAEKLCAYVEKKNGFAGRLSNDTFATLLPNEPGILERIKAVTRDYFSGYPLDAKITGRAGACIISDPNMTADSMLDMAITAKETIKGKYNIWLAVFDESMNEKRLREKYITDRMETALTKGQFDVYIQPQFHHGTGLIVGAEALVRWNDPERGVIPPGEFISVFEKTGFITRMDEYVWEKAAQFVSAWMEKGNDPIPVSVNVSREDTNNPDLCKKLLAIIEKHNIPANIFRLEITESLFTENPQHLAAVVEELHKAGFLVEMDDFGSGYSSLNILKDVPVDILKLDMRFFAGEDNLGRGGMIINAVMRMARWLGIPVIAEGVELKAHADFLLSVGCPTIQGYFYEQPMPVSSFERLLLSEGNQRAFPQNPVQSGLDAQSFWNPLSADSQVFNDYIGPAFVFEYHAGEYEILRMNRRFIDIMHIGECVMLPTRGLVHFVEEDKPKVKKAVLDAIYSGSDVKADLRCVRDDGTTPLFHVTLRVLAKSADRALLFAALDVS